MLACFMGQAAVILLWCVLPACLPQAVTLGDLKVSIGIYTGAMGSLHSLTCPSY
jgi:hypothetical protein